MIKKLNKLWGTLLIIILCIAMMPTTIYGASKATSTATLLYVDGAVIYTEAYSYGGTTYYKLQDIAYGVRNSDKRANFTATTSELKIVSGTARAFTKGTCKAANNKSYTPVKVASVTLNGVARSETAYKINNNYCMSLKDIARILDVSVGKTTSGRTQLQTYMHNPDNGNASGTTLYTSDWPSGVYIIRPTQAPEYAFIVSNEENHGMREIKLAKYSDSIRHKFLITKEGDYYTMKAYGTDIGIVIGDGRGDKLVQQDRMKLTKLKFQTTSKGTRIAIYYDFFLGVSGGKFAHGTNIISWTKSTEGSQYFNLERIN